MASEKQIAVNRRNAAKSTGPRTGERPGACANERAMAWQVPFQEIRRRGTNSTSIRLQRLRKIDREVLKPTKLTYEVIERTSPDRSERAVRRLAKPDHYSDRAYTRLKRETK